VSAGTRLPGTPEPRHVWLGDGGLRIAGDTWGDPLSPPVVLLHGGGQTRHSWGNIGSLLGAAGYYALSFDARGHGDSDWSPDGSYDVDTMIRDLLCVISSAGMSRPVLVGASMGGGTCLVAAGEHLVQAAALILVDVAPRIEREGVEKVRSFMDQKSEGFDSLEEVVDAIGNYQPHRLRGSHLESAVRNIRLASDGKYRWHWDPVFRSSAHDLAQREVRLKACARRLELPTLLVRGGLSDVLSEAGAQDFLALCRHAEYVNVASAGHMVAGDRNDAFGAAVITFVERTVPKYGARG